MLVLWSAYNLQSVSELRDYGNRDEDINELHCCFLIIINGSILFRP